LWGSYRLELHSELEYVYTCFRLLPMNRKYLKKITIGILLFPFLASIVAGEGFTVGKVGEWVTVKYDGKLVTNYVVGDSNKPYLWPLIGPGGKAMTRAYPMKKVNGERHDHPHHRSIWFGHQNIGGFDTWHEPSTILERKGSEEQKNKKLAGLGSTVHRAFSKLDGNHDRATIVAVNDYVDSDGKMLLADERTLVFRMGKDRLVLDFDIVFTAEHGDCRIGDMKDSGFSVRIPTSMDVDSKKGGHILNSEGQTDKGAWGKRATWVSYTGPVDGKIMGVAIMNHPKSFRHPTPWHVRTYGLFTANPFGTRAIAREKDGGFTLDAGNSFTLRHRVIFHAGDTNSAKIADAWKAYAID